MKFTERVRDGEITQPNQRGFSRAKWTASFSTTPGADLRDQRLHASGCWIDDALTAVRAQLRDRPVTAMPDASSLRVLLACLNWQTLRHTAGMEERVRSSGPKVSSLINSAAVRDLEALVDAGRYLLDNSTATTTGDAKQAFDDACRHVPLAQAYDRLESEWHRCLWEGWYVEEGAAEFRISPEDDGAYARQLAAQLREDDLISQFTGLSIQMWSTLSEEARAQATSYVRVASVSDSRSEWDLINVQRGRSSSRYPPPEFIASMYSTELYILDRLDDVLPKLGASSRDVLRAWDALSSLAGLCMARATGVDVRGLADIRRLAPVFTLEHVTRLLTACGLSEDAARWLIQYMQFDSARSDVWVKPFVKIAEDRYSFVMAALAAPNQVRNLERLQIATGYGLDTRGGDFEIFVRSQVADAANGNVRVHPASLDVPAADGDEQVDLLVLVGRTLLVGEVKTRAFAATPFDRNAALHAMDGAALQARRKSEAVTSALDAVLKKVGWSDATVRRVLPVVVTNHPSTAGVRPRGVAVVDHLLLGAYVGSGVVRHFVGSGPGGFHGGDQVRLYDGIRDAGVKVGAYLLDPPQLTVLEGLMRRVPARLEILAGLSKPVTVPATVLMEPPTLKQ